MTLYLFKTPDDLRKSQTVNSKAGERMGALQAENMNRRRNLERGDGGTRKKRRGGHQGPDTKLHSKLQRKK